jgi:hypothetical protein
MEGSSDSEVKRKKAEYRLDKVARFVIVYKRTLTTE